MRDSTRNRYIKSLMKKKKREGSAYNSKINNRREKMRIQLQKKARMSEKKGLAYNSRA